MDSSSEQKDLIHQSLQGIEQYKQPTKRNALEDELLKKFYR